MANPGAPPSAPAAASPQAQDATEDLPFNARCPSWLSIGEVTARDAEYAAAKLAEILAREAKRAVAVEAKRLEYDPHIDILDP